MPPKKRALNSDEEDLTLTKRQALIRGFVPDAWQTNANFRSPSNPTIYGYSSGYHEAVVTTDTLNFLRKASDNGDGTHTLPTAPSRSFFSDYSKKKVNSASLKLVLQNADGFRTDTAQTILSAPNGEAAGHTGSGIKTIGQAGAHDLLRKKIMDIVQIDPAKEKGLTEDSINCLFAAITVTSMAPGKLANTVSGGTASLKASQVKSEWEENRNRSKAMAKALYDKLEDLESKFVLLHAKDFLESTETTGVRRLRRLSSNAPTSPKRKNTLSKTGGVSGGDYDIDSIPTLTLPPSTSGSVGTRATRFLRAKRRTITKSPVSKVTLT